MKRASFEKLRDQLQIAQNPDAVVQALGAIAKEHGFDWFTYLSLNAMNIQGLSSYPNDWQQHYIQSDFHLLDPVVQSARAMNRPFTWGMDLTAARTKNLRIFMEEAASIGIRSGVSVPVHNGFGKVAIVTFSSASDAYDPAFLEGQFDALVFAAYLHSFLVRSRDIHFRSPLCPLSPIHLETLSWLVQGKSIVDVAELRKVSPRAIDYQLSLIRKKLDVATTYQAIAIAVDRKWITIK